MFDLGSSVHCSDDATHRPLLQRQGSEEGHALRKGAPEGSLVPGWVHRLPAVLAVMLAPSRELTKPHVRSAQRRRHCCDEQMEL